VDQKLKARRWQLQSPRPERFGQVVHAMFVGLPGGRPVCPRTRNESGDKQNRNSSRTSVPIDRRTKSREVMPRIGDSRLSLPGWLMPPFANTVVSRNTFSHRPWITRSFRPTRSPNWSLHRLATSNCQQSTIGIKHDLLSFGNSSTRYGESMRRSSRLEMESIGCDSFTD